MASNRPTYANLADMPLALQDFLLSDDYANAEAQLQKLYQLKQEQVSKVGDDMMDAIFGDLTLQEAVEDIKTSLVPAILPEDKWKLFLSDLIKLEAWPLRDVFGEELTRLMSDQGMSTAGWPVFRVLVRPLTYSGAATEVAAQAGFTFMGPQLRERMRELIMSKLKGVRIDSQVKEVLMRPSDFGGLGLDEPTAAKAVAVMGALISKVPIMSEEEYADHLAEEARKRNEAEEQASAPSAPASPEDAEIQQIKAKMADIPKAPPTLLDSAIEKIWESLPDKPTDEYLVKRLRNVISSRLRDVRSQLELTQLLQRDTKVGGIGIERGAADRMAAKIEEGYQSYRGPIMEEEKKRIEQQMGEQKLKVEDRRKREAEEHAKWYQEKIGAKKQEEERQKQFAETFRKQMVTSAPAGPPVPAVPGPMDAKEQKRETERFGQMVPATSAGAAPIAPASPAGPAMAPGAQARPEVKVSLPTAQIQAQAAAAPMGMSAPKPRMDDIRGGPKLVGLVQELREMSLPEFRRLARDPEQAAAKIMQKLDTLGGEAFEKRLAGIQAWQQSPLQQTYLGLVADSFKVMKPVVLLAEEKRKAGVDAPSPEEMSAIISLNGKLHF